ncbi:MAG TPA: response regulator [Pilimelia sp.]|nr:response regulator [Pilimelia sp.]
MADALWHRDPASTDEAPVVLLVDDEPTVLATLDHQLSRDYRVVTAPDGPAALAELDREGPVAVVISDMRMPGMDGIELLGEVRRRHPDTTRMLHTARGDLSSAIAAINDSGVFRFLRKPCPTGELRRTVRDAVERHRLALAEREMLDKTLRTSLQALFGCLELASPQAFARAGRIRTLVSALCRDLALEKVWEIEVAAMASQLGAVTVPPSVLQKLDRGLPLPDEEQRMIDAMPDVAVRLLGDVPMLEDVVAIVRGIQPAPDDLPRETARPAPPVVSVAVAVLRAAIEFETFESRGVATDSAIAVLERQGDHQSDVLGALRRVRGGPATPAAVRALRVWEVEVGMRIAEDVVALNGPVLIGRGMVVTEVLLGRMANFKRMGQVAEPVLVTVPGERPVPTEARR